ncbi:MAG TPA: hypothetical protein VEA19_00450 [Actinomycetota bacterium]|nr:hypothetical protein [Actinomycetota bacterium]
MRRLLMVAVLGLLTTACNPEETFGGIVRDPDKAGLTFTVKECGSDPSGNAYSLVQLRSEKEWGTVLFNVDMSTPEDVVIGQGSTSFNQVAPGQTYEKKVIISFPSQEVPAAPKCAVRLDFASAQ